jgi:flagellar M-ring protein FliF
MSVAVNVKVDFNEVSSTQTIYTPVIGDNGIISWVEITGESTGTDTSGSSGVAGTGNNTDTTTYTESADTSDTTDTSTATSDDTSGEATSSDSYNAEYLVNQLVKEIQDNGGNITDMSVALIVNADELTEENIAQYKELVAYSAGISTDKVSVSCAKFLSTDSETVSTQETSNTGIAAVFSSAGAMFSNLGAVGIFIIGGIIIAIVLAVVMKKLLSKRKQKAAVKKLKLTEKLKTEKYRAENPDENSEEAPKKAKPENMPGEIVLNETREQALKRQIKEFSSGNPETVAQLLRVWMKEDDNN